MGGSNPVLAKCPGHLERTETACPSQLERATSAPVPRGDSLDQPMLGSYSGFVEERNRLHFVRGHFWYRSFAVLVENGAAGPRFLRCKTYGDAVARCGGKFHRSSTWAHGSQGDYDDLDLDTVEECVAVNDRGFHLVRRGALKPMVFRCDSEAARDQWVYE